MKAMVALYLLALHLVLGVALLKPGALARVWLGQSEQVRFIVEMRHIHGRTDPLVPAGAVIFLGDSITQFLPVSAIAPLSVNYGISGQRSDQLLESMDRYASMARASAVVVMIGTNDLYQGREQGLEARYRAILAKVPAGVPVVLSGIPPMAGKDVRPLVGAARSACQADVRCRFVDAAVTPDMLTDGVHLSARGYAAWVAALRASGHIAADLRLQPSRLSRDSW
jgi:hypothetical protein